MRKVTELLRPDASRISPTTHYQCISAARFRTMYDGGANAV